MKQPSIGTPKDLEYTLGLLVMVRASATFVKIIDIYARKYVHETPEGHIILANNGSYQLKYSHTVSSKYKRGTVILSKDLNTPFPENSGSTVAYFTDYCKAQNFAERCYTSRVQQARSKIEECNKALISLQRGIIKTYEKR